MPARPPKWWMDRCIAGVEASGSAADPAAVCGDLWFNKLTDAQRRARVRKEVNPPELRADAMRARLGTSTAIVPMVEARPMTRAERTEARWAGLLEKFLEHEDVIAPLIGAAGGAAAFFPTGLTVVERTFNRLIGTGTLMQIWDLKFRVSTVFHMLARLDLGPIHLAFPNEITVTVPLRITPGGEPLWDEAIALGEQLARILLVIAGLGAGTTASVAARGIAAMATQLAPEDFSIF